MVCLLFRRFWGRIIANLLIRYSLFVSWRLSIYYKTKPTNKRYSVGLHKQPVTRVFKRLINKGVFSFQCHNFFMIIAFNLESILIFTFTIDRVILKELVILISYGHLGWRSLYFFVQKESPRRNVRSPFCHLSVIKKTIAATPTSHEEHISIILQVLITRKYGRNEVMGCIS